VIAVLFFAFGFLLGVLVTMFTTVLLLKSPPSIDEDGEDCDEEEDQ
jgi:hypothetical protein